MNKKILVYLGDNTSKEKTILRVCKDLNIPCVIVEDKDLNNTIGYLMELDGFPPHSIQSQSHFAQDLMILQDISDEEIQAINVLLDAQQIKMERKAMLTQHNQHWSVEALLVEIEKEHRYFQQVREIQFILQESATLRIEDYTKESWLLYEKAFYHAYQCIKKECSIEEMSDAHQGLIMAKQQLIKQ